jgi:hypothetical protein
VTQDVLDRDRIDDPDQQAARRVSKVVEAKGRKAGGVATGDVAPSKRGWIGSLACHGREDVVARTYEVRPLSEPLKRREGLLGKRDIADPRWRPVVRVKART